MIKILTDTTKVFIIPHSIQHNPVLTETGLVFCFHSFRKSLSLSDLEKIYTIFFLPISLQNILKKLKTTQWNVILGHKVSWLCYILCHTHGIDSTTFVYYIKFCVFLLTSQFCCLVWIIERLIDWIIWETFIVAKEKT